MAQQTFISEIHVPIKQDDMSFQERQIKQWGQLESRMQERRKLWEDEFDRMRQEFFTLKPSEKSTQSLTSMNLDTGMRSMFETDADGIQRFRIRFDVCEFQPEEIQVKVQDNKLIVNARHEEKSAQTSVSREYSRQVDIPCSVDQEKMQCILSKDGILSVEAPLTQPSLTGEDTIFPIKSPTPSKSLDMPTQVKNPIITEADGSRKLRLENDDADTVVKIHANGSISKVFACLLNGNSAGIMKLAHCLYATVPPIKDTLGVDIGEFKPEDVVVKTMDRKLIVHAEHEEKTSGRTLHKEFNKEYDLPESVDPATIQAYLTDDKKLTIEAPLKPLQKKTYTVTQSQDVRKVVVSKESSVTISDGQNRPVVTISVHRK